MAKVIPTFFLGEQVIKNSNDIGAYLLKFLFWNPGNTSEQIENTLMSMRFVSAKTEQNIYKFPNELQNILNDTLKRFNSNWSATVKAYDLDKKTNVYKLDIALTSNDGSLNLTSKDLEVRNGVLHIRTEMDPVEVYNDYEKTW